MAKDDLTKAQQDLVDHIEAANKPGVGHNNPPNEGEEQDNPTVFDVARDDFKKELNWKEKYDKEHKLRLEAEGETHLVKAVGMNSPEMKSANLKIEEMRKELDRVKLENQRLEQERNELLVVNKKLNRDAEENVDRARKAGM